MKKESVQTLIMWIIIVVVFFSVFILIVKWNDIFPSKNFDDPEDCQNIILFDNLTNWEANNILNSPNCFAIGDMYQSDYYFVKCCRDEEVRYHNDFG